MTIIESIRKSGVISAGDRVLCAVSGGADSMCLLHCLSENARSLGISVCAASFDHMLRGEASAGDCEFVARWCENNGIECLLGKGDVREKAAQCGMSEEEAARSCRYEFLENCAQRLGCTVIATAHNANDNAETVLFNLTRGSGTKGLCGIPPVRGNIIRPLLSVPRAKIERYNAENAVPYVTDQSNNSDDYTRNVLRHHVTPVLEGINPAFFEAVCRSSELLREDDACLEEMARTAYGEHYKNGTFPAAELKRLPKPVAMRVLRLICGSGLSRAHAQSIYDIAGSREYKLADIQGMRVSCDRGVLRFDAGSGELGEYVLKIGQELRLPECGMSITVQLVENSTEIFKSFNIFDFKYDSICGNISLTPRKSGDKLRLKHRKCTKSLKDLFNEAGTSVAQRALTPVFRDERGVVAVYGFGVDERCMAKPGDRVLRVKINKINLTGDN